VTIEKVEDASGDSQNSVVTPSEWIVAYK
jgi:hypothetical protein